MKKRHATDLAQVYLHFGDALLEMDIISLLELLVVPQVLSQIVVCAWKNICRKQYLFKYNSLPVLE